MFAEAFSVVEKPRFREVEPPPGVVAPRQDARGRARDSGRLAEKVLTLVA